MKKFFFFLMVAAAPCFCLTSCNDDEEETGGGGGGHHTDPVLVQEAVTGEPTRVYATSAQVGCSINGYKYIKGAIIGVSLSEDPNFSTDTTYLMARGKDVNTYEMRLSIVKGGEVLQPGTTYYYRAVSMLSDSTEVHYGATKQFTTQAQPSAYANLRIKTTKKTNIVWARYNVGASSIEGYGDYFAWGEPNSKRRFDLSTYTLYTDSFVSPYNNKERTVVVRAKDDAATVNWGAPWRQPTKAEIQDLLKLEWRWDVVNGVPGYFVMGKKDSKTQEQDSIFLPTSGYYTNSRIRSLNERGLYWSATLTPSTSTEFSVNERYRYGESLQFGREDKNVFNNYQRYNGFVVRAVCTQEEAEKAFAE